MLTSCWVEASIGWKPSQDGEGEAVRDSLGQLISQVVS